MGGVVLDVDLGRRLPLLPELPDLVFVAVAVLAELVPLADALRRLVDAGVEAPDLLGRELAHLDGLADLQHGRVDPGERVPAVAGHVPGNLPEGFDAVGIVCGGEK